MLSCFSPISFPPHGLQAIRLLCPWDSPGKHTGVGCHALLQGIFLMQGWNLHLLHWKRILHPLSYVGNSVIVMYALYISVFIALETKIEKFKYVCIYLNNSSDFINILYLHGK